MLTGRYQVHLPADAPADALAREKTEAAETDVAELPDMEFSYSDRDAYNRAPNPSVYDEPLNEELERPPRGFKPPPATSVTIPKLVLRGLLLQELERDRARPRYHGPLFALITIMVEVAQRPDGMHLLQSMPLFPVARNKRALDSSHGLKYDQGQAWTFFKEVFGAAEKLQRVLGIAKEEPARLLKTAVDDASSPAAAAASAVLTVQVGEGGEKENKSGEEKSATSNLALLNRLGEIETMLSAKLRKSMPPEDNNATAKSIEEEERERAKAELLQELEATVPLVEIPVTLYRQDLPPMNIVPSNNCAFRYELEVDVRSSFSWFFGFGKTSVDVKLDLQTRLPPDESAVQSQESTSAAAGTLSRLHQECTVPLHALAGEHTHSMQATPPSACTPSGLQWERLDDLVTPEGGLELMSQPLAEALATRNHFTEEEWAAFGIRGLRADHYIKSGHGNAETSMRYYRPVVPLSFNMETLESYVFATEEGSPNRRFVTRLQQDLQQAARKAAKGGSAIYLRQFGPAELMVLLATSTMFAQGSPEYGVLTNTTVGEALANTARADNHTLMQLQKRFPDVSARQKENEDSLLGEASKALSGVCSQLGTLSAQLRHAISLEARKMDQSVALVESIGNRSESDLEQQLLLAGQQAVRPSFELLLASLLSSTQEADLRVVDPQLPSVVSELNGEIITCQLRGCRLRLLGMCADLTDDLVAGVRKTAQQLLAATFESRPMSLRRPTEELLQHLLRRADCNVGIALTELERVMQWLGEGEDELPAQLQQHLGLDAEVSSKAAYLIAHLGGFEERCIQVLDAEAFASIKLPPAPGEEALLSRRVAWSDDPNVALSGGGVTLSAIAGGPPEEAISAQQLSKAVDLAERGLCWRGRLLPLGEVKLAGTKPPSVVEVSVLGQNATRLAGLLCSERSFIKPLTTADEAIAFDPRFLAFEFAGRFMLRQQQSLLIKDLEQSALGSPPKSCCQQMMMGGGKTSVVAPLLSLLLADGVRLVMQIVPDALLDMSINVMRGAFGATIVTPVFSFSFERSSGAELLKALRGIRRRLLFAAKRGGVVCSTPGAVKSLLLSFLDRLQQEERTPRLFFCNRDEVQKRVPSSKHDVLRKCGKAMLVRRGEAEEIRQVLCIMQGAVALIDEVDMVLHPLRSELNFPIGQRVELHLASFPDELAEEREGADQVFLGAAASKMGSEEPPSVEEDTGSSRWLLPLHLLDGIFAALGERLTEYSKGRSDKLIIGQLKKAIEKGTAVSSISRTPHFVLLQRSFYDEHLVGPLTSWCLLWYREQACVQAAIRSWIQASGRAADATSSSPVSGLSEDALLAELEEGLRAYTCGKRRRVRPVAGRPGGGSAAEGTFSNFLQRINTKQALALLNLCKTYVCSLLPHVLSKRDRVDFGLLSDEDAIRIKQMDIDEEEQRTGKAQTVTRKILLTIARMSRELLAVPFMGKDAPSRSSEFANPEVIIGLTVAAYRIEGLRERDMKYLISQLLLDFGKSPAPQDQRFQHQEFERWKASGLSRWAAAHGDDLEPPSVLPLALLQVGDPKHIAGLMQLLKNEPAVINYYLDLQVFRKTQCDVALGGGYAQEKLSASGMDVGSSLFKIAIGFSGTPSNLVPSAMKENDSIKTQPGSDAQMINVLTDPAMVRIHKVTLRACKPSAPHDETPPMHASSLSHQALAPSHSAWRCNLQFPSPWSVYELLQWVAKATSPPFRALIDTGALVTGMDNEQVVRFCLETGLEWARAAVFLDPQDRQMVVFKGGGPAVPLSQCSMSPADRFTFYDQVETSPSRVQPFEPWLLVDSMSPTIPPPEAYTCTSRHMWCCACARFTRRVWTSSKRWMRTRR